MQQTEFTDSFIKGMLGWIRWIASSIANMFQSGSGHSSGGASMISWFADNWLKLLIAMIVVGVLVDWMVWMARWRPYWVWFRKRRILLDNDVDEVDDDMMLRYGGEAALRGRGDELDEDGYGPDDGYGEDDGQPGDYDEYDRYEDEDDDDGEDDGGDDGEDDGYDRRGRYGGDEDEADEPGPDGDFDALYDDEYGDYAPGEGARGEPEAPEGEPGESDEPDGPDEDPEADAPRGARPARFSAKRRGLFAKRRAKARAEEDPFSIDGDFFDDLGEDPMDDIVQPRAKLSLEPDAQDTSIYQRPRLLPGDEPGAVRGADEEGWHTGYTQRSAERNKRRKQDARA